MIRPRRPRESRGPRGASAARPQAPFNSVCPHSEFWFSRDPGSFTDAETRLREFGPVGSTRPRKAVLAAWGLRRGREAVRLGRPADQQCH